jgi:hypothetical protein
VNRRAQFAAAAAAIIFAAAGIFRAHAQQINSPTDVVAPVVPLQAQPFPLQNVQLLDGPFRDAMLRDKAYLFSLDSDRVIYTFRQNYGLSTSNAVPLRGWEAPGVQVRGCIPPCAWEPCSKSRCRQPTRRSSSG